MERLSGESRNIFDKEKGAYYYNMQVDNDLFETLTDDIINLYDHKENQFIGNLEHFQSYKDIFTERLDKLQEKYLEVLKKKMETQRNMIKDKTYTAETVNFNLEMIKEMKKLKPRFEDKSELIKILLTLENREKCFKAQFQVSSGVYCYLTGKNNKKYAISDSFGNLSKITIDYESAAKLVEGCIELIDISCVFEQVRNLVYEIVNKRPFHMKKYCY